MLLGAPARAASCTCAPGTSDDWGAVRLRARRTRHGAAPWLAREVARGRSMNQSPYAVRLWLTRDGAHHR